MGLPVPTKMVEPFAANAPIGNVAGGKTLPFPVPTQLPGAPGAASLNDGFTPANMTPLGAGGIQMSGPDLNGILYLITTTIAAVNAGQLVLPYDAAYQAAIGGYAAGAMVLQAADITAYWLSTAAGNMTDPDTGGAGWLSSKPLHISVVAAAGTTHDLALPGASDFVLDIDTSAGAATFDSIAPQRDGQRLIVCCTGAGLLTVGGAGGTAGNRIRQSAATAVAQNDSFPIQYVAAISRWVAA